MVRVPPSTFSYWELSEADTDGLPRSWLTIGPGCGAVTSADPRLHTRQWRTLRVAVLNRDRWSCQIRLDNCTTYATQVDHVTEPLVEGGSFLGPGPICGARVDRATRARAARLLPLTGPTGSGIGSLTLDSSQGSDVARGVVFQAGHAHAHSNT